MTTESNPEGTDNANPPPTLRSQPLIEVCVFLFLIVPSMVLSFFLVRHAHLGFTLVASSAILRDLALVSLVLYFVWRNGEPLERIGWVLRDAGQEIILGIELFIPFFFGVGLLGTVLRALGLSSPAAPLPSFLAARGPAEFVLAFFLVVIVSLAEETIFRGYLILRFQTVTRSPTAAVLLSAAVFSLGHGYEGTAGVLTVAVMGAIFAVIYLWRGSLIAPITMHFLQDLIGVVLLPLLGLR